MSAKTTADINGVHSNKRSVWYASHPKLRTEQAKQQAGAVAKAIKSGSSTEPLDEVTLFTALHTCAYLASGDGKRASLSPSQRRVWARRWHRIREYAVQANLGLVYSLLARFRSSSVDDDQLQSDAMYALAQAVRRFNPFCGYRFSTYACNCIARACMRRSRREQRRKQRLPFQYDPSFDRPTERTDLDEELRIELLHRALNENWAQLTELESRVLSTRFPMDTNRKATFKAIGNHIGLSKERIRQIQNSALGKLRRALEQAPGMKQAV